LDIVVSSKKKNVEKDVWGCGLRREKNVEYKILLSQNFKKLKTSQQNYNQTYITKPSQQLGWILHA